MSYARRRTLVAMLVTVSTAAGVAVFADGRPAAKPATTAPSTRAAAVRPFTYGAWATFKPGSSATLRCDAGTSDGPKAAFELTYALAGLSADAAELTTTTRRIERGQEKPNGDPEPSRMSARDDGHTYPFKRTGTRTVTATGRTFACDVYEGQSEWGPCSNDATFALCTSPDVPGGIVEMTVTFIDDPAKTKQVFRRPAYTVT